MFEEIILGTTGMLLFIGCPLLFSHLLLTRKEKTSSTNEHEKKKRIANYRLYWNNPKLLSELSEEQRNRIKEKFFESLERNRKQNAN